MMNIVFTLHTHAKPQGMPVHVSVAAGACNVFLLVVLAGLQGFSVVGAINAFKPSERAINRPFRLPITDVFKGQRGGVSVGKLLAGGAVKVGTPVRVMPSNEVATVRSIEVDGATATLARAGDSADLTLAGQTLKP